MINPHHTDCAYWEPGALHREMGRVLDICHGCRRCWNVCPSFGNVFKRIDALEDQLNTPAPPMPAGAGESWELKPEGEHAAAADPSLSQAKNPVEALTDRDHQKVVDECYQCKLCFNLCPYHPPHRFQLDFPRLMQRHKAVGFKAGRRRWVDFLLAQVDLLGVISCLFAPLVNWTNSQPLMRLLMEKTLGIHRRRDLPLFYPQTFRQWWDWRGPKGERKNQVALFYGCSINYNDPKAGKAAVAVLEKNGLETFCPEQICCGMPHLDGGDLEAAKKAARRNLAALVPLVQRGVPILTLGPTCSYMLKDEYPALLQSEDAKLVSKNTFDIHEYLIRLKKEGKLNTDFTQTTGTIAYQPPCHLKAQNIGFKSKELLDLLPGASVSLIDRCSAHDGTWSMKNEYFDLSMKTGKKLFDEIEAAAPSTVATDCPLAGLQIKQGTGRATRHPIEIVAEAYGITID